MSAVRGFIRVADAAGCLLIGPRPGPENWAGCGDLIARGQRTDQQDADQQNKKHFFKHFFNHLSPIKGDWVQNGFVHKPPKEKSRLKNDVFCRFSTQTIGKIKKKEIVKELYFP